MSISIEAVDPNIITPTDLIVARGLSKTFGFRPVLRGLTFTIARGSTVALMGTNGAGKTTLLRILATLSKPSAGELLIGGWMLPSEAMSVRAQLGYVGHQPLLYDDLTAAENLGFFAKVYGIAQASTRITTVLAQVGLAARSRDQVRSFSRGMQQRLALARAMLHDPSIFLLDEPYTGLDVQGAKMLDGLFQEWRETGKTVIASLHQIAVATQLADSLIMLGQARLLTAGTMLSVEALTGLFGTGNATPTE
jgi:heme exporter protein A